MNYLFIAIGIVIVVLSLITMLYTDTSKNIKSDDVLQVNYESPQTEMDYDLTTELDDLDYGLPINLPTDVELDYDLPTVLDYDLSTELDYDNDSSQFDINIDKELDLDLDLDEVLYAAPGKKPTVATNVKGPVKKLPVKLPDKNVKALQKNVDKLKLTKNQLNNYVKNYGTQYQIAKKLNNRNDNNTSIKVNGKSRNVPTDVVARLKKDKRNIDAKAIAVAAGNAFKGKTGKLTQTQYNNLLKSFINLNYYDQNARREVPNVAKKTKNDFRFDINKKLKDKNIKLSDPSASKIRIQLANNFRDIKLDKVSKNVYNKYLDKLVSSYKGVFTKLENRIDKAVKTLNEKNSSGVLPPTSTYRDLKSNGLIYFDDKTSSWKETQKAKKLGGALTINNKPLTSNQMYNDIYKYVNLKYPNLSNDYKFINFLTNSTLSVANNIYGNLTLPNYQNFINNYIDAQVLARPYYITTFRDNQIRQDVLKRMSDYYNTTNINPVVVNQIGNYIKQRDLSKMNISDYKNLVSGLVKGYGLGSNTLSPTGQGLNGRITIDNKNLSLNRLQTDVVSTINRVYQGKTLTQSVVNNMASEILTYLNTKGGNVDASNYGDLLTGLVRGFGMGNQTLNY